MSPLQALAQKQADLQALLKAEGKTAITTEIQAFLAKYIQVNYIQWDQYAPYFNDGEPCVFGVREVYIGLVGNAKGEYQNGRHDSFDLVRIEGISPELVADFRALSKAIMDNEAACQAAFGDDCSVTANRDGVTTSDCSHD